MSKIDKNRTTNLSIRLTSNEAIILDRLYQKDFKDKSKYLRHLINKANEKTKDWRQGKGNT